MKEMRRARRAEFLDRFDLSSRRGLEIGPFDRPVFTREACPGIQYADVQDTDTLREMARRAAGRGVPRDPDNVVHVDHVLLDRRLDEVVPLASLDFVFCAHVLEHIPDMIGMLKSVERILVPGGIFLMAYPDRRFTYDSERPATTLDQLRDRHRRGITRPDPEIVHEHFLMHRKVNPRAIWERKHNAKGPRTHTPERARARAEAARTEYVDVHCNVLSSEEFGPLLTALRSEGLIGLDVAMVEQTQSPQHEFYAALEKPLGGAERTARNAMRALGLGSVRRNPRLAR